MTVIQGFSLVNGEWIELSSKKAARVYANGVVNSGDRSVFFPNLLGDTPESMAASTLGNVPVTAHVKEVAKVLSTRSLLSWGCRIALAEELRGSRLLESHLDYLQQQGLITGEDRKKILYVENPMEYNTVFQAAARSGLTVYPYMHNSVLKEVAQRNNAHLASPSDQVIKEVILAYSNKITFRDTIEELNGVKKFPRFALGPTTRMEAVEVAKAVDAAISFARACQRHRAGEGMLVVQISDGAGGFGTLVIPWSGKFEDFDGERVDLTSRGELSWDLLVEWLLTISTTLEVDVAPFLPIIASSSMGVISTPTELVLTGERIQLLDSKLRFDGYSWSIEKPTELVELFQKDRQLMVKFAKHLHQNGFHSEDGLAFGVDILYYVTSQGTIDSFIVEMNARLDGTSSSLVLFHLYEEWVNLFLENKISFEQHDHEKIPVGLADSLVLRDYLREVGLPLTSKTNPYGITILTPPFVSDDHAMAIIVFSSETDAQRRKLVRQFAAAMQDFEADALKCVG